MNLSSRVSLAAGAAVAVVLGLFALVLHHSIQSAVDRWERENVAALGHHAASMVAAAPLELREATAERLGGELAAFGVKLDWARPGDAGDLPGEGTVRVPVGDGAGELLLTRSSPARQTLGRRLFALYASLLVTLFVGLTIAIQGSIFWGLVRPLRKIHAQLRTMRRGPWRTSADTNGVAEVVALAKEVESLGLTLDHRIPEWVEAERKASTELARRRLQAATLPDLREIRRLLELPHAADTGAADGSAIVGALAAVDRIEGQLDAALETREMCDAPADGLAHREAPAGGKAPRPGGRGPARER